MRCGGWNGGASRRLKPPLSFEKPERAKPEGLAYLEARRLTREAKRLVRL
jgi:hypothetical protein